MEKRVFEPKNLINGAFPIVIKSDTAGATIAEGDIVVLSEGKLAPVTAETLANVAGIAAHAAIEGVIVNYYATGQFFASAINLPESVTLAQAQAALEKLNIYIKE